MPRQRRQSALQILGGLALGTTFALAACQGSSSPVSNTGDSTGARAPIFVPVQQANGEYDGDFELQSQQPEPAPETTRANQQN